MHASVDALGSQTGWDNTLSKHAFLVQLHYLSHPNTIACLSMWGWSPVFRWFKFTLKPPYSIAHDKLWLAIWDTSFWTFRLKFGHKGTLRHMLGPILVIFEICQFLTIPGPFEYFPENGGLRKSKFSQWRSNHYPPYRFSFRRRGP